jgi:hypothetical protein
MKPLGTGRRLALTRLARNSLAVVTLTRIPESPSIATTNQDACHGFAQSHLRNRIAA